MRSRTADSPPRARRSRSSASAGELEHGIGERVRVGCAQQPAHTLLDQRQRAALGDGDHGQTARLRLEHDLAEGVGAAGEEEDVGARVGAGEALAVEPAEEPGGLAEALAQSLLLGAAADEHEAQSRARARGP